jgi:polyhydroxybutyrate depolymerase
MTILKSTTSILILLILALQWISCGNSTTGRNGNTNELLTPGWHDEQSITVSDLRRFYRYYIPDSLSSEQPPVVFFLHGGNQSMRKSMPPANNGSAAWPDVADKHGFILMVPNGTNPETADASGDEQRWNDCRVKAPDVDVNDVDFLRTLMDWSVENLEIDAARIYVTGASNGGLMTFRAAIELPDKVAAAAPFIANNPVESECPPATPTPIMITVGTEDPLMPYTGGEVAGSGSFVVSADSTRDFWVELNGITGEPTTATLPDIAPNDESVVVEEVFQNVNGTLAVRYLRMVGAGHSMPSTSRKLRPAIEAFLGPQNNDIEGAEQAWQFMSQF